MRKSARILFPDGFDDRSAYEITPKGWANILVEPQPGEYYSVFFYDPIRARQTLESWIHEGKPYFTEQGALVLIPEVTVETIVKAVQSLLERNYLAYWKAAEPDPWFKPDQRGKYDQQISY